MLTTESNLTRATSLPAGTWTAPPTHVPIDGPADAARYPLGAVLAQLQDPHDPQAGTGAASAFSAVEHAGRAVRTAQLTRDQARRESLLKMPVRTLLEHYADEALVHGSASNTIGVVYKAKQLWHKHARGDDARLVERLMPVLRDFLQSLKSALHEAILRAPFMKSLLLTMAVRRAHTVVGNLVAGAAAPPRTSPDTLMQEANAHLSSAERNVLDGNLKKFFSRASEHIVGATLHENAAPAPDAPHNDRATLNLSAGNVVFRSGPANLEYMLRLFPGGHADTASLPSRALSAVAGHASAVTMRYPQEADNVGTIASISWQDNDGQSRPILLVREDDHLKYSQDDGASWKSLGPTCDELEALKRQHWVRFFREFTLHQGLTARLRNGLGSSHVR